MARPMPDEAPVTMQTLLAKREEVWEGEDMV